jgi:hypothetical protein
VELIAEGRSLSPLILLPATAIFTVMLILVLRRTASRVAQFIVFALWLRWIMSAYHTMTLQSSPAGLSWNALGSVAIVGLGLTVIKGRKFYDVALVPIYLLIAAVVTSGAMTGEWPGTIDMVVKFAYLAVIILATVDAINEVGNERFAKLALWPFIIPFGLQALSVVLGAGKGSEADGSVSFIGGFRHEAAFSLVLASGLFLVCVAHRMGALAKALLIAICFGGILLANYRTAILATAPLVAVAAVTGITRRVLPEQRALVAGGLIIAVAAAALFIFFNSQDRFGEVLIAIEQGPNLIKPLDQFTDEEADLMSARPYIWSMYLMPYLEGSPLVHAFGFGPSSWEGKMVVYAHNTLISYFYEIGLVGVFATVFLWVWMIVLAARVSDGSRSLLLAGHASFLLLNMATMPMWNIEGLIFYGLLCGVTIARFQASRRRASWAEVADEGVSWEPAPRELA